MGLNKGLVYVAVIPMTLLSLYSFKPISCHFLEITLCALRFVFGETLKAGLCLWFTARY